MALNLVNLVKDQLGKDVVGQFSSILGESPEKTQATVEGAVPAMLGSLVNLGSSSKGATNLLSSLNTVDDNLLGNFAGMLGKGQSSNLLSSGTSLMTNLLGAGDLGKLAGVLSGFGGIGKSSANSLLGMLAPLILGVLKRQVMGSGGLNAGNLMGLLSGQKAAISQAMPAALNSQLGSAGLGGLVGMLGGSADAAMDAGKQAAAKLGSAASSAANTTKAAASGAVKSGQAAVNTAGKAAISTAAAGNSMMRWLIPLIIAAVLVWLAFTLFGNRAKNAVSDAANTAQQAAGAVADTAQNAANTAANAAGDAVNAATETATNAATAATAAVAGMSEALKSAVVGDINVGQGLTDVFASSTDILNGITDEASAQAALPKLTDLNTKLEGFTGILDKLPAEARSAVSSAATEGSTAMQGILSKVNAIPGVEGILKQVMDTIMATLAKFTS